MTSLSPGGRVRVKVTGDIGQFREREGDLLTVVFNDNPDLWGWYEPDEVEPVEPVEASDDD